MLSLTLLCDVWTLQVDINQLSMRMSIGFLFAKFMYELRFYFRSKFPTFRPFMRFECTAYQRNSSYQSQAEQYSVHRLGLSLLWTEHRFVGFGKQVPMVPCLLVHNSRGRSDQSQQCTPWPISTTPDQAMLALHITVQIITAISAPLINPRR